LELRSFFRQFSPGEVPDEYYSFLRGETGCSEFFRAYPSQAGTARLEAWLAELGITEACEVDQRIRDALSNADEWILIGGPPC
jgi:DNA (cytosine-5)-methyltransferase 1